MKIDKGKLKIVCLISCLFLIVSSCTIQKKLHSNGFHVEWKSLNKKQHNEEQNHKESARFKIVDLLDSKDLSHIDSSLVENVDTSSIGYNDKHLSHERITQINSLKTPKLIVESKKIYSNQKTKNNYNNDIIRHNATRYAILAHVGLLIAVLALLLLAFTAFEPILATIIGLVGVLTTILATIFGLIELFIGDYGRFPVFATFSIYIYTLAIIVFLILGFAL